MFKSARPLIKMLVIIFVLTSYTGIAQNRFVKNPDSIFNIARNNAFDGQRELARDQCFSILDRYPTYYDAAVLIGRTLAWDHLYDSARTILNGVIAVKKNYYDAFVALIDLETWDKNYSLAYDYCNQALNYYPTKENLLAKKADLQFRLGQTAEAKRDIRELLDINPANEKAHELLKKFKRSNILNKISLDYTFEYFDNPWTRRWSLFSLSYSRKTKIGSVIARIYAGDVVQDGEKLFEKNHGLQYEIESYPKISRLHYAFIAYAYSSDKIFPRHRLGIEVYQKLPASLEMSLGIRFMQFSKSEGGAKNLMIYTGSIGYYFRNFWLSFRPYITPKNADVSQSYNLEFRSYFRSRDQYLSATIGTGSSPDDPVNDVGDFDLYKLNKYKIKVSYQHLFFNRLIIDGSFSYQYEEYDQDKFRDVFSFGIKTSIYF